MAARTTRLIVISFENWDVIGTDAMRHPHAHGTHSLYRSQRCGAFDRVGTDWGHLRMSNESNHARTS
jgi:hypothetical protein